MVDRGAQQMNALPPLIHVNRGVCLIKCGDGGDTLRRILLDSKRGAIMADDAAKPIPINEVRQESGAHELATSPEMEPYLEFIKAVMQDHDPTPQLERIRQLPREKRYVWRVASALKWGLADCDDLSVEADRQTLT